VSLEWRNSLQIGQQIDAVKAERIETAYKDGWSVGIIQNITENDITIAFESRDDNLK